MNRVLLLQEQDVLLAPRDARKRLNVGNLEVRGYIGEFSWREMSGIMCV